MNLQALLVSTDDSAADVLGRVLPSFGIAMDRSSDPETTIARIQQQKFDALIVDFDDPKAADDVLQLASRLGSGAVSVALVSDPAKVRNILSGGAHFVLYKPVSEDAARAGLRAAAALLSRERRRAFRVPVQAPVEITLPDHRKVDGILLDISETGMDVLTAEPQMAGLVAGLPLSAAGWRSGNQGSWTGGMGQSEWPNWNSFSRDFGRSLCSSQELAEGRSYHERCWPRRSGSPLQTDRPEPGRLLCGNRRTISGTRSDRSLL